MKKQQGVVLFFALIVLLLMTIIGVSLAMNSTQSLRMAGSGVERLEAVAHAQGAQEKFIMEYEGTPMLTDLDAEARMTDNEMKVNHVVVPLENVDVECGRSAKATSGNNIRCRRIEVTSDGVYGREDLGRMSVVTGIQQEVLTGS
ncbi:pilus assembly protein PilX [Parashewanella curva]|uniref:Pilus assembly protein PilX n=2 Tax=Parashewanella curva TaxID=2338552 RepID=A0A3L8Q1F7_9GAMM|nr:pilus assembly PilX N-terminal domain-containing protein [Parashewanella curva]RLV61425.1 pilus assembly protein PilX [Parashewanella curva]